MIYSKEFLMLWLAILTTFPAAISQRDYEEDESYITEEAIKSDEPDESSQAELKQNIISKGKNADSDAVEAKVEAVSCAENVDQLKRQVDAFRAKLLSDTTKYRYLKDLITAYEAQIDGNIATISAQIDQIKYLNSTIADFRSRNNIMDVQITDMQVEARAEAAKLRQRDTQLTDCRARLVKSEASSCLAFGNSSDIQILHVPGVPPFLAPCESRLEGSGWTVIQRRLDGTENFNRSWYEYRDGFGDLRKDFFIGLGKIHRMTTTQPHDLLVYFQTYKYTSTYLIFSKFLIGDEASQFKLLDIELDHSYDESKGISLTMSRNQMFSTYDRDNDNYWLNNCAKEFNGGWWFNTCYPLATFANLNGKFGQFYTPGQGIVWSGVSDGPSLKSVQMMIRPKT